MCLKTRQKHNQPINSQRSLISPFNLILFEPHYYYHQIIKYNPIQTIFILCMYLRILI